MGIPGSRNKIYLTSTWVWINDTAISGNNTNNGYLWAYDSILLGKRNHSGCNSISISNGFYLVANKSYGGLELGASGVEI